MNVFHVLMAAGVLAALSSGTSTSAIAAPIDDDGKMPKPAFLARQSAEVQAGYDLYVSKACHLCHGRVAQGSPMSGPPLAAGATYEYLLRFVRVPTNIMPPYFPETLSNDEVRRISLYLQALPKDLAPADIPALRKVTPTVTPQAR